MDEDKEMMDACENYFQFIEQLKSKFGSFFLDAERGADNRSAALRARKLSIELRDDLKDFRSLSIENDKSKVKHRVIEDESMEDVNVSPGEPIE